MSNQDKPIVVATRWWWVRHAPVREDGGSIYGQKDIGCDTSDRDVFEAVAKILPRDAVWYASNLKRTHQTAEAIWAAGFPRPATMPHEAAFAEQHLGRMAGHEPRGVPCQPAGRQPLVCRYRRAGAGRREFHGSLQPRARRDRAHQRQPCRQGRDRGGHGGTIKAAVGLALGGQPEKGPRLRHRQLLGDAARPFRKRRSQQLAAADGQPAALDRRRLARGMHQPAGPEVVPETKLA